MGSFFASSNVVLNSDLTYSLSILKSEQINNLKEFRRSFKSMRSSLSAFLVYLGLSDQPDSIGKSEANLWYLPNYDIELMYKRILSGEIDHEKNYGLVFVKSKLSKVATLNKNNSKCSMCLFINAPFKNEKFWEGNKNYFAKKIIEKSELICSKFQQKIKLFEIATPATFFKHTRNNEGACYGLAATRSQVWNYELIRKVRLINGLHIASHWNGKGHGIPFVSYSGYSVAKTILNKLKDKRKTP